MITVTSFGKIKAPWRDDYIERIERLIPFRWNEIPLKKNPDTRPAEVLNEEKSFLQKNSNFYLLEVEGKAYSSPEFSRFLFKESDRHLVVGPAVGFHPEMRKKASGMISLSTLTMTHALAQTLLAESIYRSVCELKNHPFVK